MTTLYFNRMRNNFNKIKVAKKSELHNLRLDPENKNVISSLSKNNIYMIENNDQIQVIQSTPKNTQQIKSYVDWLKDQELELYKNNNFQDLESLPDTKKTELIKQRTYTKNKIEKWISNEKTGDQEKEIFQNILNDLKKNIDFNENNLTEFTDLKDKIIRRNDKIKAIKKLADFDILNGSKNRNIQLKIQSTEVIFKIPDHNNINVAADHWVEVVHDYIKDNYPNNRLLYAAVHMDENGQNPHAHVSISGYNINTKDYDLPDQEMKILDRHMSGKYPFKNKKWCELTDDQRSKHGEIYQSYIFHFMNKKLKKFGYEVDFKKKTKEQIEEDNYSFTKTKRSADREYNLQNKLKENNDREYEKLEKIKNKRSINQKEIRKEKNNLRVLEDQKYQIKKEIEENKNLLIKLKNNINNILKLPNIINRTFSNIVELFKKGLGNFEAFEELNKMDRQIDTTLKDLNIEDEQVSNAINRTMTETIENLEKSHTGTIEEDHSFDMVKKEISNKKKKLKPIFSP